MFTGYYRLAGDTAFQAPRRFWSKTVVAPSYAYIFTDPQPNSGPDGVFHTAELPYLFGNVSTTAPPKVANLSRMMLDYWISFAVSLTPNDGKGTISALRSASVLMLSPLTLHLGPHWGRYEKTKVCLNTCMVENYSTSYRKYWSLTATART